MDISDSESLSEWGGRYFKEQYVHISIPVQVAMFNFSWCAITVERNTEKKKES